MYVTRLVLALLVSVFFARQMEAAGVNLMVNGSFETQENMLGGEPETYGDWEGDWTEIVGAQNGITPADGSQMLRFIYTLQWGPNGVSGGSNLWQIIDVGAYAQQIAQGYATAQASVKFNRIFFDAETDTQFDVRLGAYAGLPGSFPTQNENTELVQQFSSVFTDADLATWQLVTVELPLPRNTDFIAIALVAAENVQNDGSDPEFDGHYCDDVKVTITVVPEPSPWVLLGMAAAALLAYAVRRSNLHPGS